MTDADLQVQAHLSPSPAKFLTKKLTFKAPSVLGNVALGAAVFFHLSKESHLLNPKLLKFPKTRINIKKPQVDIHIDSDDILLVISDELKELKLGQKNLVAQMSELKKDKADNARLMCFSQIVSKFVKKLYLRPLGFPSNFYDRLEDDANLREVVEVIGATLGIKSDQILEWAPLIEDRHEAAHPPVTKAEFIATVNELIAQNRLSKSSTDVFIKIYDFIKPI